MNGGAVRTDGTAVRMDAGGECMHGGTVRTNAGAERMNGASERMDAAAVRMAHGAERMNHCSEMFAKKKKENLFAESSAGMQVLDEEE